MRLEWLEISNYKGFSRSDRLQFGSGFNVLIGQNNSGKSAILESLRLSQVLHKPHRSDNFPADIPLSPSAEFRLKLALTGREVTNAVLAYGKGVYWPLNPNGSVMDKQSAEALLRSDELVTFELFAKSQTEKLEATVYPSHGRFKPPGQAKVAMTLKASGDRQSIEFGRPTNTDNDSISTAISSYALSRLYVFDAQRFNVGRMPYGDEEQLLPNASNLPRVLLNMQPNRARFERFNRHISEIFPSIEWVSVNATGSDIEIRVLAKGVDPERQDLAISLHESGSGIGQVLAIIYVAMTMRGAVIGIDEPNSFLHPGAAKKLLDILKYYGDNQYILSTHSSGLLSASNPSKIVRVFWRGGESRTENINGGKLDEIRAVLSEIGSSLSDVFGPEGIVWVEGETEEECFPLIYREFFGALPNGVVFLVMRSTGEIERTNAKANATLDIYQRMSAMGHVIAPTVSFSFDRELRTDKHIQDLERRSVKTKVLPRRMFENYLLNEEGIAAVIGSEASDEVGVGEISAWIESNRQRFMPKHSDKPGEFDINVVDGARLISELFHHFSNGSVEYRKRVHSVAICRWILKNRKDDLSTIAEYISQLLVT